MTEPEDRRSALSRCMTLGGGAAPAQNSRQIGVLHGDVNNRVVLVPKRSSIHAPADMKEERVDWHVIQPRAMGVADAAQALARL